MENYAKASPNSKGPFRPLLLALFAISALSLNGCRATQVQASTSIRKTDSVVIRETVRDTVVTIGADSSMIRALLECDSLGQVRLRELVEYRAGERVRPPKIEIRNNVLTATAQVDSTAIYLQLKDRFERQVSTQTETVTVEVNRLTWGQELWIKVGRTLTVVLIGFIAFKLGKPKILQLWQTITKLLKRN